MTRTLIALAAFLLFGPSLELCAQGIGHTMPPPVNIVGAGFNLEYSAKQKKVSTWTLGLGTLATGILFGMDDTRNTAAPWVVGGLTAGVSMSFSLSGLKWQDRAADLWQCGYSPDYLYESVPDSVGDDPPRRYRVPRMINDTPIKLPARMYTK